MRKVSLIQKLAVFAFVFILLVGCSNSDTDSQGSDENVKIIQTYLENELKGPSDELKKILEQEGPYPPELEAYLEENYKPLVADLERLVNSTLVLIWLREAAENGYQLQPTNIEIQKTNSVGAYDFEVKVEYSKDDQTNTATITGRININEDGKIVSIRNIHGFELLEELGQ
ncbi:hypothetical protein ACOI1C_22025 [Bacillus sp. DJP31]|uniref:hypothetical protein n=1 Tax=Bacillus sp. DJP31 TaxID=3409789 RepID=UPI003BB800C5